MAQNNRTAAGNDLGLKNVMVTRFSALGNVVMTIPVLYSACRCYTQVRFVMVTRKSLIGLYVNSPENLTVVGIDIKDEYNGLQGAMRLIREMREKYSIDAYVDLQNDRSTNFIAWLCKFNNIKTARFNRALHYKRQLTRKTGKVMLPLASSRSRYRETFFKIGLPIEEHFTTLYAPAPHAAPTLYASITTDIKKDGCKWIGIAPFAAHPEKEYPLDKMEDVIQMLLARGDTRIYIYGAQGRESQEAETWASKYAHVISLAGKHYGFSSEMALTSNLDVMLTMDSANMHIAAIVGTPTVSIWGATHHYCGFKGWHQSEDDMVQVPLSCRPCSIKGDKPCYRHDRLCLTAIRPETIYAKILQKLEHQD